MPFKSSTLKAGRSTRVMAGNESSFSAKTYVLAAGCWSGEIAGGLGFHLPITPCRGQMMEFESARDLPFVVRAGMHYLVPRPERRLLVGTTAEYTGFEKSVTAKGLHSILEGATRLAPLLSELPIPARMGRPAARHRGPPAGPGLW